MDVGIVTIIDNNNYGNRLQNYALQFYLKKNNIESDTILNSPRTNNYKNIILNLVKEKIKPIDTYSNNINRKNNFNDFNKKIVFSSKKYNVLNISREYSSLIVGSDQVWNPNYRLSDFDLLNIKNYSGNKIAFSASFGVGKINNDNNNTKAKIKNELTKFRAISVRENEGKKIINNFTGLKDVEVLVDPTMLLSSDDWDLVSKKPIMLKSQKFILNYFLGNLSEKRKKEIERIAMENDCEIINILDENSPFYECGPSEFLYLEKNAFLICTDSFHSCVFAVLYNRPFVVFNREDNTVSMNSRIETLIKKFNLKNREYNEKEITKENLNHDYTEAYSILENERIKADEFLKKALDMSGEKND